MTSLLSRNRPGRFSWLTSRRPVLVLVFFALLSGISLSPLSVHLGSMGPAMYNGEWDYYHFHWNLWWVRYAVFHGENPFYSNKVLAPFRHNLSYHSLTPSLMPLYAVLEPPFGHLRAANLIMWISVMLTGFLMYLLMRRQKMSPAVALLGGIVLAFCPYMMDHVASGHLNLITVFWLPTALLLWERVAATRKIAWAVTLGVVLWGMWMTDTLIIFWGGLLLGPCALLALFQAKDRRARLRLLGIGGLILAITLVLAWFLGPLQPTLKFDTSDLQPARLKETLHYYSVSPKALFWPTWGRVQRVGFERDETLGLLLVILIGVGLIVPNRDRLRWFWLATGLFSLLLTWGPYLDVSGTWIPLPFRLIHEAFHGQMRTPIRFLPPAMVGLILFVGRTYDPWLRRVRSAQLRRALAAGVMLVFMFDFGILKPYPATPAFRSYSFYTMMGRENYPDYDYVVLEVPSGPYTGWRLIGSHPEAMYYGIIHHKRMVSGLLSRIPISQHLFYEQSYLIGWLADVRPLDLSLAGSELHRFIYDWPIGYIVVHQDWETPEKTQEVLAFLNASPDLCYLGVEKDAVLYRTRSHPAGCPLRTPPETAPGIYTIPIGESGDEGFIGAGWYRHENIGGVTGRWAGGQNEVLLYASLPTGSDYTLTVHAVAFNQPRTVRVVQDSLYLGEFTVQPSDWADYSVTIPAESIDRMGGNLIFSLSADGMVSAAELGLSGDTRPLTLAYDWVQFRRVEAATP